MPDDDLIVADEDFFDEKPHDALAFHYVEGHETSAEAFEAILLAHIADVRASLDELHQRAGRRGEPVAEPARATAAGDGGSEPVDGAKTEA